MMTRPRSLSLLALPLALLVACGDSESPQSPNVATPPRIVASFEPLRWVASELAADFAQIETLTPADADPLHYKPNEAKVQDLQQATLILLNGAGAEAWIDKIALPMAKTLNASNSFARDFIEIEGAIVHSHGPGGEHTHDGLDPHVWLDPQQLREQARAVHARLKQVLAQNEKALSGLGKRLQKLEKQLNELHAGFESLGKRPKGEVLLASHPAYNYVARRYGWEMYNLDIDPETMPSDEAFALLRSQLADKKARFIFWESKPLPEIAARFKKDFGLDSVLFSPGEMLSAQELAAGQNYLTVMRANIERLRPVFAAQ
ncbi:MAG: hypothetical protein CSA62_08490 [Planctomycetota bacterium]|nr:MAG: hypothetical protein CSA62_08490 [Planctomycetota bacterium]